eukprot:TRINITY_DN10263_c0_g1_i1.p1 TRINITY_DN10263_c0_g1~~TRINITY_DN10263_c0_g1_i1.p1  ORF type:complete len:151 (+),score=10.15 TRINITY_DN10263_c0_g1_i1:102-554(+)
MMNAGSFGKKGVSGSAQQDVVQMLGSSISMIDECGGICFDANMLKNASGIAPVSARGVYGRNQVNKAFCGGLLLTGNSMLETTWDAPLRNRMRIIIPASRYIASAGDDVDGKIAVDPNEIKMKCDMERTKIYYLVLTYSTYLNYNLDRLV